MMKNTTLANGFRLKFLFLLFVSFLSNAQEMQTNILGGAQINQSENIAISAGNSLTFRIINTRDNCGTLKIEEIVLSNTSDFSVSHPNLTYNIRSSSCKNGNKYLDFTIKNTSNSCATSTSVTIKNNRDPDFSFTISINSSPQIYVLGGNPFADINNGSTVTSPVNGTYFGVVDEGSKVTRSYAIANIGSCPLDILTATSSNPDFEITTSYSIPWNDLDPYFYILIDVTFTGPVLGVGTQTATISIGNSDTSPDNFEFNVSAEMFNYNIPGPGGITNDFRLWLKSTRGIKFEPSTSDKVRCWLDLGTNSKNAEQSVAANQPSYMDDAASNINFNPVIKFENDGGSIEQYLHNSTDGFYSQDIFIVMIPNSTINSASTQNTIFSGISSGNSGDITGVGFGNYSTRFTNETLSYNQDVASPTGTYNGVAELNSTYTTAGIINVRNDADIATKQELLYNSNLLTTTTVNDISYANVNGSKYWIGRNFDIQGSLNGRIAEIFTFASRVTTSDRQKIESYLAIKYGITLGASSEAQKSYVNSFGTSVWDISANAGYNYHVAGIGRDSISDLNQKQSKTIHTLNEVTISLGGLFATNSANTNEFKKDGDFLVWGCNNSAFSGSNINTVTLASGITTSLTRIDRKWKIIESKEAIDGDVENVYISIPSNVFSSFSKAASEEYVLIVADSDTFGNGDIIDVIPLKSDGNSNLQTWYDFDGVKYFTFGKAPKLSSKKQSVNINAGSFLVGEYNLNLNVDSFTISSWIRRTGSETSTRTILAKGEKLQLRLNSAHKIEVMIDDAITPRFVSDMAITDTKWHQITFVYNSGTIFLYVDGILDKSEQDVVHPSPNYNRFSVGAVYISKNNIINSFFGEIDEVLIWDVGLSENQIKYLMNQEIEKGTSNYITGKSITESSLSNEISMIPWGNLRAYYDFNSFYGSTVEGLTDSRYFLRLNYLNKSKNIVTSQTAPLPYTTVDDGNWEDSSIWLNSDYQTVPNSLGLDGVTSIDWNIIEINNTINLTSDVKLLSLKLNSNRLNVSDNNGVHISHYLLLNGVLDLKGESQLIQTGNSYFDESSTSYLEKDQQGQGNKYRYNDWSSPVYSGNDGTNYATIQDVLKDGTDPDNPGEILYVSGVNGTTSPLTLSTYWMYKYANSPDNSYSSWSNIGNTGEIYSGEGFLMKGAGASGSSDQNYVFIGKPNNGDIELTIAGSNDYLVGNPYPSAIEANQFILDNEYSITGTLYFWEHYGGDSHKLADYQAGYALYSLGGGTPAVFHPSVSNVGSATKTPKEFIAVGQGFFVVGDSDGGTIKFNNNQRAFQVEDTINSVFLKNSNNLNFKKLNTSLDKRPKIRIAFISTQKYQRQLLLTIDKNTTDGYDWGYNAEVYEDLDNDMFWMIGNKKYGIQCVNSLNDYKEIQLGIITKEGGLVEIKIDSLENVDKNIKLFIKDKITNINYPINNQSFQMELKQGSYLSRFLLVFEQSKPVIDDLEEEIATNDLFVYMNNTVSEIQIKNNKGLKISKVQVINYLGQTISNFQKVFNANEFSIPAKNSTGVYFVQITTEEGVYNKKIFIN